MLSTNVAETSLTIRGITVVIDTGLEITRPYVPEFHAYEIRQDYVAQSSILQRKGRAGRTAPGVCYHLYSEDTFNSLPKYAAPAIVSEDITSVYLELSHLRPQVKDIEAILRDLIQPPPEPFMKAALDRLRWYRAISDTPNEGLVVNRLGNTLRLLPLDPAQGMLVVAGYQYGVLNLATKLAALLEVLDTVQGLFIPPNIMANSKKKARPPPYPDIWKRCKVDGSDHLTLLCLYLTFEMRRGQEREWCKKNRIRLGKLKDVKRLEQQVLRSTDTLFPKSIPGTPNSDKTSANDALLSLIGGAGGTSDVASLPRGSRTPLLKCLAHALSGQCAEIKPHGKLQLLPHGRPTTPSNVDLKPDRTSLIFAKACSPCVYSELVIRDGRWSLNYLSSAIPRAWIDWLLARP